VRYLNIVDHSEVHETKHVVELSGEQSHDFEIAKAFPAGD